MKNNEINDLYNYGYKIVQNKDYFKFSLDSILLADFVKVNFTDKKMLDLCTGNAPIPIILSNKLEEIIGIEIQVKLYYNRNNYISLEKLMIQSIFYNYNWRYKANDYKRSSYCKNKV